MSDSLTTACEILELVEKASGPKEKTRILKEVPQVPVRMILQTFFEFSFNPFITFGVTVDPVEGQSSHDPGFFDEGQAILYWDDLCQFLTRLSQRQVTGNDAKAQVAVFLDIAPALVRKWVARLLNKNPRCGLAEKGILKIWPGLFPTFECQLCEKWDKKTLPKYCSVEPKWDGIRALFVLDRSNPAVLSRNGKPLNNCGHILSELLEVMEGFVVDGEVFNQNWEGTVTAVFTEENGNTDARFKIFDSIPIGEFKAKNSTEPLLLRQERIAKRLSSGLKYTSFSPGTYAFDPESIGNIMRECLELGYEGVVIKDLDATYKFKRSTDWVKCKPWIDVDLPIVGFADGEGKWTGGLGAIIVEGGEEKISRTEVGSGLTDDIRREIWANRDKYLGRVVEVKYQNLTPDRKLRFPIFKRIRQDR